MIRAAVVAVCAVVALGVSAFAAPRQLGLGVDNGILIKDGKPFSGVGVNYFDLFYRTLKDPNDTSYRAGLKTLAEHHIPFARFMACGYWPVENDLYFKDKQAYFKLMDAVVESAEQNGVGLIPSFFFCYSTVPDLVGEPMSEWGNPNSKTSAFMRKYTREVVSRYRNSPAIWGWEFGNEIMLQADLGARNRPPVWPNLGTAKSRTERDDLSSQAARSAQIVFAREVRKLDPYRVIMSGNAYPRAAAWHLRTERSWKQDSTEQFAEELLADNADPMDVICVHMYPDSLSRFDRSLSYLELLRPTVDIAAKAGKPLFVEEFGTDETKGHDVARAEFDDMLAAIEKARVPLAAVWVYDFDGQKDTYDITTTNSRSYQLEALDKANGGHRP